MGKSCGEWVVASPHHRCYLMTAGFSGALDQTQSKECMRFVMRAVVGDTGKAHASGATWGAGCVQGDSGVKLVGPVCQGVPVPLPWPFLHRRSLQAVPWCLAVPLGTLLP